MPNPFERAIDVIRERGWWQNGGDADETGERVCIFLALPHGSAPVAHLLAVLELPSSRALWAWNDDPARTEEDVILALKHAAVSWDGD